MDRRYTIVPNSLALNPLDLYHIEFSPFFKLTTDLSPYRPSCPEPDYGYWAIQKCKSRCWEYSRRPTMEYDGRYFLNTASYSTGSTINWTGELETGFSGGTISRSQSACQQTKNETGDDMLEHQSGRAQRLEEQSAGRTNPDSVILSCSTAAPIIVDFSYPQQNFPTDATHRVRS